MHTIVPMATPNMDSHNVQNMTYNKSVLSYIHHHRKICNLTNCFYTYMQTGCNVYGFEWWMNPHYYSVTHLRDEEAHITRNLLLEINKNTCASCLNKPWELATIQKFYQVKTFKQLKYLSSILICIPIIPLQCEKFTRWFMVRCILK